MLFTSYAADFFPIVQQLQAAYDFTVAANHCGTCFATDD